MMISKYHAARCLSRITGPDPPSRHHLLRYPHPLSLRRTGLYASFLGISEALHLMPSW
jgi:hypothetical protein